MGYRADETALAARRDNLRGEVEAMREEHAQLTREGERLSAEVRRKRWSIRWARLRRWVRRHPKFVAVLVLVAVIAGWTQINSWRRAWARRARIEALLGTDCKTRVHVVSQPPARLFVGRAGFRDVELGKTPIDLKLCEKTYALRLVHRAMIPWQRQLVVRHQRRVEINASLVSWHPSQRPRDGVLVHSTPEGALAFIDGVELGRTPLFVRGAKLPPPRRATRQDPTRPADGTKHAMLVGLAAPGYRPAAVQARLGRKEIWVQLAPQPERKGTQPRKPR